MKLKILAAAAGLVLAAGSANAVTFTPFGAGATVAPGYSLVTNFNAPLTVAGGYSLSGTGTLLTGTSGDGAAPAFSTTTQDPNQYLSVEGGETETLTVSKSDIHDMSFYVGSLDAYNSISFTTSGGTTTYTGAQLAALTGAVDDGNQSGPASGSSNGIFTFAFTLPIESVALNSSSNSFEIAAIGAAVPEPATWAMMLVGFMGLGAMVRASGGKRAFAAA
jgi:hypothetical protein